MLENPYNALTAGECSIHQFRENLTCYIHLSLACAKALKRKESHLPVEQRLEEIDLNAGVHRSYLISKNTQLETSTALSTLQRG